MTDLNAAGRALAMIEIHDSAEALDMIIVPQAGAAVGDTAIALLTLALAAEFTLKDAADIANHASGIVVGKLGTATLTPDELLAVFS